MDATKEISRRIMELVNDGMDVLDALRAVCGAEAADRMIADLYEKLRAAEG